MSQRCDPHTRGRPCVPQVGKATGRPKPYYLHAKDEEAFALLVTLSTLFRLQQYQPDHPVIKDGHEPLTESHLRRRLCSVLKSLGLAHENLSYHALRRSGASLAYNNNVNFEAIKLQGAW